MNIKKEIEKCVKLHTEIIGVVTKNSISLYLMNTDAMFAKERSFRRVNNILLTFLEGLDMPSSADEDLFEFLSELREEKLSLFRDEIYRMRKVFEAKYGAVELEV